MNSGFLNDLLECSVCLKPLNEQNKVLPCQHTFCKSCLHNIVKSHKELKCPECRVLVHQRVDDLPSNILLIRLLDGIRFQENQLRQSSFNAEKTDARRHSVEGILSEPMPATGGAKDGGVSARSSDLLRPFSAHERTSSEPASSKVRNTQLKPQARALYAYKSDLPSDLTFEKDDTIYLSEKIDSNWMSGECNGRTGVFPINYVEIVHALPTERPYCVALFDFESDQSDQDRDCLHFVKNDRILVIRKVDENWAEGMLKEKIGIFPLSFVQMNDEARKLVDEMSSPREGVGDNKSQRSGGMGAAARRISSNKQGGKQTKKRHSFPSIGAAKNKEEPSASSSYRHSMEVGASSMKVSSTNSSTIHAASIPNSRTSTIVTPRPAVTSTTQEVTISKQKRPEFSVNSLSSKGSETPQNPHLLSTSVPSDGPRAAQVATPKSSERATRQRSNNHPSLGSKLNVSTKIVTATYSYQSQKFDELDLIKGDTYTVTEVCNDGWCIGTHVKSKKSGVFPGNYITPISHVATTTKSAPPSPSARVDVPFPSASSNQPSSSNRMQHFRQPKREKVATDSVKSTNPSTSNAMIPSGSTSTFSPGKYDASSSSSSKSSPIPTNKLAVPGLVKMKTSSDSSSKMITVKPTATKPLAPSTSDNSDLRKPPPRPAAPVPKLTSLKISTNNNHSNEHADEAPSSSRSVSSNSASAFKPPPQKKQSDQREKKRERSHLLLKMITGGAGLKKSKTPPSPRAPPSPSGPSQSSPLQSARQVDQVPPSPPVQTQPTVKPSSRDRYYATMNYPANSAEELDLREGDVVIVLSRRPDGWFKGTQQRSGKTGHFPSTFVERIPQ